MQMRMLGSTGLRVSALGLGLAALGRPAYINRGRDRDLGADRSPDAMERRCHEMLDLAYEAGVRYVDAARSYGRAEAFLGSWLGRRPDAARDMTVGSKWGYVYTGGWQVDAPVHEVKDLSAANLERQYAESRAILGSHLHLYQVHSATLESGVLDDERVLRALLAFGDGGLIVGLTVSGPDQAATIRRALSVVVDGHRPFRAVQATWNLLETSAGPALAEAHAAGWGVIIKEVLANGRLTEADGGPESHAAREHATARGLALEELAMAAAVAQPWADVVLSGAVNDSQLAASVRAMARGPDSRDVPAIAQPPREYWSGRSRLTWR